MVLDIIEGIKKEITDYFPSNVYNIYTEGKDFTSPCFVISLLSAEQEKKLNNRYYFKNHFEIKYMPSSEQPNKDCFEKAAILYDILKYISVNDDLVNSKNVKYEIKDGVLSFFMDINMFVLLQQDDDAFMEEVSVNADTAKKG